MIESGSCIEDQLAHNQDHCSIASILRIEKFSLPNYWLYSYPGEFKWRPINNVHSRRGERIIFTNKSVPILPDPRIATFSGLISPTKRVFRYSGTVFENQSILSLGQNFPNILRGVEMETYHRRALKPYFHLQGFSRQSSGLIPDFGGVITSQIIGPDSANIRFICGLEVQDCDIRRYFIPYADCDFLQIRETYSRIYRTDITPTLKIVLRQPDEKISIVIQHD